MHDSRITYNLNELTSFFRQHKLTNFTAPTAAFNVVLSGIASVGDNTEAATNNFIVKQVPDTANVLVYSATEQKYYKAGKSPTAISADMDIAVTPSSTNPNVSSPIKVGDTGISFSVTGPLSNLASLQANQMFFSVEAPYTFSLVSKLKELDNSQQIVADMLMFRRDSLNVSYENIWNQHFNDAFRLSGLLLAYVERVNKVWQTVM
jgi:hypothetical protein